LYRHAMHTIPRSFELHYNAGVVAGQLERRVEAITFFEQALQLRPEAEEARKALAALRDGK
jgi:tetratricopeptide (TPR) repeat protein